MSARPLRRRTRVLYCCASAPHRTQRAFVNGALDRGWIIDTAPPAYAESFSDESFPYDAVISHVAADATRTLRAPVGARPHVTLHADAAHALDMPSVVMDHAAAGRWVAQHFIGLRFEHFAAFGVPDAISALRFAGFADVIREAGLAPPRMLTFDWSAFQDYKTSVSVVGDALQSMAMPLAVMAHNDRFAVRIVHTCWNGGLSIPSQVGLCGFDNNPIACDLAPVPLSSVDTDPELQARTALSMVADLLQGLPLKDRRVLIAPRSLVVRRSSGIVASKNTTLAKALAYIHQHAWSPDLSIAEIAGELGVAETTLFAAFRGELSVTPLTYIMDLRIEKARKLLEDASLRIREIRPVCGFSSDYQMYMAFKRATGRSPREFRSRSGRWPRD